MGRRTDVDNHDGRKIADVLDFPSAGRARAQRDMYFVIDAVGNRPMAGLMARLASRPLRGLHALAPPERRGLSLGGTLRIFELRLELVELAFQSLDLAPATPTLGCRGRLLTSELLRTQLPLEGRDLAPHPRVLGLRPARLLVRAAPDTTQAITFGFGSCARDTLIT
jgi:hypothetical protein